MPAPSLPPTPRIFTAEELQNLLHEYDVAIGADRQRLDQAILASHSALVEEVERLKADKAKLKRTVASMQELKDFTSQP